MSLKSTIFTLAALVLCATGVQAQGSFGYANEKTVSYRSGKRFSSGEEQGFAIKITKEKAALLKGYQITGLRACFSTGSNIENCKAFVSSSLDGAKDFEESISTVKLRFQEYKFSNSYTISGDTELYVGFTLDYTTHTTSLFSVDNTAELPTGLAWAYTGEGWENIECGGAPAIYLMLDKAPDFNDVLTKPVSFDSFYTAGNSYDFSGQIYNCGNQTINSLDIAVKVADGAEQVLNLSGLEIAPKTVYDYVIKDYKIDSHGNLPISVIVNSVNGAADADMSDNASSCSKYIYPVNAAKRTLLEYFTGLGCLQCPGGTSNIKQAIAGKEEKISLVAHHTYGPDVFCMKEDYQLTWFFNGQTYAPGVMANRRPYAESATSPILPATESYSVEGVLAVADLYAPYVDIQVTSDYSSSTREVCIKVDVTTFEKPSYEVNSLNVWLTQDNFSGKEFPQTNAPDTYTHNNVFRASLTSFYGEHIELVPGETVSKTYTYTLPIESVSTYSPEEKLIKWIPEDMHVVAFVGGITDYPYDCPVYNVAETTLINSAGGVNDGIAEREYVSHEIFNLQGVRIDETNLTPGIYIVRKLTTDGFVHTEKIIFK